MFFVTFSVRDRLGKFLAKLGNTALVKTFYFTGTGLFNNIICVIVKSWF